MVCDHIFVFAMFTQRILFSRSFEDFLAQLNPLVFVRYLLPAFTGCHFDDKYPPAFIATHLLTLERVAFAALAKVAEHFKSGISAKTDTVAVKLNHVARVSFVFKLYLLEI